MLQKDFNFSESDINKKLSVLLMADSFFYAVYNSNNELIAHRSFQNLRFSELNTIGKIINDENLKAPFTQVNVCCISIHSFFTTSENEEISNIFPSLESKNRYVEKVFNDEICNYFGVTEHQESLLNVLFGESNYRINTPFVLLAEWFEGKSNDFIHLHKEESHILIFIQNGGKPVYYNAFQVENATDILYFVLAASRKLGISPETGSISLSGWIESDSKLYETLDAYYGQLFLIDDTYFKLSAGLDQGVKAHYYFIHFLNIL